MSSGERDGGFAASPAWFSRLRVAPGEALFDLVAGALQSALADEAAVSRRLAALEGRSVAIGLRGTERRVHLRFTGGRMERAEGQAGDADVHITGGVADFVAYVRASRRGETVGAGRIEISGDLQTAQGVQALLGVLDVDLENALAQVIGDVAAHQLGRAARALGAGGRSAALHFERDLAEYLKSETTLLPSRREVEAQARAAFVLADDVARAAARLERLEKRRP